MKLKKLLCLILTFTIILAVMLTMVTFAAPAPGAQVVASGRLDNWTAEGSIFLEHGAFVRVNMVGGQPHPPRNLHFVDGRDGGAQRESFLRFEFANYIDRILAGDELRLQLNINEAVWHNPAGAYILPPHLAEFCYMTIGPSIVRTTRPPSNTSMSNDLSRLAATFTPFSAGRILTSDMGPAVRDFFLTYPNETGITLRIQSLCRDPRQTTDGTAIFSFNGMSRLPGEPTLVFTNTDIGAPWRLYDDGTLVVDEGTINRPTGFTTPWSQWRFDINNVIFTGPIDAEESSLNFLFFFFSNMTNIEGLDYINTRNMQTMIGLFELASSLTSLDLSSWDTSNVTDMSRIFSGTHSLTDLNISGWDTSNMKNMSSMFGGTQSLTSLDLSHFDTSNVTSMGSMFSGASSLSKLDLSNFNTSNVISMSGMFNGASSLTSLDLSHFDTSNVEGMSMMFANTTDLTRLDISGFDTRNVRYMNNMFWNANSLRELTLGEHFRFMVIETSWPQQNPALPPVPDNDYFTGVWQNVGNGTVGNPLGEFEFTSDELMAALDRNNPNSANYAGQTWVWQPTEENRVDFIFAIEVEGELDFGRLPVGYAQPAGRTVTVTNVGDQSLNLFVSWPPPLPGTFPPWPWSGGATQSLGWVAPGESATFTVRANTGMSIGVYPLRISIHHREPSVTLLMATIYARFEVYQQQSGGGGGFGGGGGGGSWNNNRPSGNVFSSPSSGNNDNANNNVAAPQTQQFTDVSPNDWFFDYVESAVASGLLNGVGNGEFAPNVSTTRAMFVTVLWRLAGSPNGYNGGNFSDVADGNWYSEAIAWAAANGIVTGVGNGYFAPNLNITREQMGLILYRYVGDLADEIMDRNYVPQNTATRAEMAAVMLRLSER
ncbi:MAG: BspA family leucine-rich repeat surface protein [Oscillospiraceae bacterium]|nr:BspA family leucine-rich repeat surface protein [Oscillospiraceae bacterium]